MKNKKAKVEFRYYEIPTGQYILPKIGPGWEFEYGNDQPAGVLHFHNYMEIGYCHHGSGRVTITDKEHRYGDNMFTVIPANVPHTTNSDRGHICFWEFLFLDISNFVKTEMRDVGISPEDILRILNRKELFLRQDENPRLARIVLLMIEECQENRMLLGESLKGLLRMFVVELLRMNEEIQQFQRTTRYNGFVERATEYVEIHFSEEMKMEEIADYCGLSESHFRRIFVESTNMKLVDYVNMVRIDHACQYLIHSDLSMDEIGKKVGYQTPSSFNRNFKRITGYTPMQWKKKGVTEGKDLSRFHVSAKKGWEARGKGENAQTVVTNGFLIRDNG